MTRGPGRRGAERLPGSLALPPALWPRFLLMAGAILALTADLADLLVSTLANRLMPLPAPGTYCWYIHMDIVGIGPRPLPPVSDPTFMAKYAALYTANLACFEAPNPLPIPARLTGVLIVTVLCVTIYLLTPAWRIFRSGLISAYSLPGLRGELDGLARTARVRVRFAADLLNPAVGGLAFGRAGRRYVVLNRGLLQLAGSDRAGFRAIMLHELAHVRGRDLDVAYLTVVIWRVFLAVVLLPTFILFHSELDADALTTTGQVEFWVQLAALALTVLVLHHSILRERELRADARAVLWCADSAALLRVLDPGTAEPPADDPYTDPVVRWVKHWSRRLVKPVFGLHPPAAQRYAAAADPGAVPATEAGQGFSVGLVVSLSWTSVLLDLVTPLRDLRLVPAGSAAPYNVAPGLLAVTGPAGFVLCLAGWRIVLGGTGARAAGSSWIRIIRFAAAVCAGLLAGDLLTGQGSLLGPEFTPLSAVERATWWGLLIVGTCVCVGWFAAVAWAWRPVLRRSGSTAPAVVGALLGAALLGCCLGWTYSLRFDVSLVGTNYSPTAFLKYAAHTIVADARTWPSAPVVLCLGALLLAFPAAGLIASRLGGRDLPQ